MKYLGCSQKDITQQVLRTMFNVVSRNQDDHVKNNAFLMNQNGEWRLSPAFDVMYAYNPGGEWTNAHQMSINGKNSHFELNDLISFAEIWNLKPSASRQMLEKVITAVRLWQVLAVETGIDDKIINLVHSAHRLNFLN